MATGMRWSEQALEEYQKRSVRLKQRGNAASVPATPTEKPKKRGKYGNAKTEHDGIQFDSKREARRWIHLEQLQREGRISKLRRQVTYQLIPPQRRADGKAERACSYIADYVYVEDGKTVVEDTKGAKTKDYVIKRKLMLHVHGITIIEV